jgi:hypothetical protein
MDYKEMLLKYEQEKKLRLTVAKFRDANADREAKLLMYLKDVDQEMTGHFTALTPEDIVRIFNEVWPSSHRGYRYHKSSVRLEFHETGNAQRLIDMYGKDILHVVGHGWYVWDDQRFQWTDAVHRATFDLYHNFTTLPSSRRNRCLTG